MFPFCVMWLPGSTRTESVRSFAFFSYVPIFLVSLFLLSPMEAWSLPPLPAVFADCVAPTAVLFTHVNQVPREENLAMVRESVEHLKMAGKEVMLDLEHFFDGWKANREYTMQVLLCVGLAVTRVPRLAQQSAAVARVRCFYVAQICLLRFDALLPPVRFA